MLANKAIDANRQHAAGLCFTREISVMDTLTERDRFDRRKISMRTEGSAFSAKQNFHRQSQEVVCSKVDKKTRCEAAGLVICDVSDFHCNVENQVSTSCLAWSFA
jgi:hypothetical protein